MDVVGRLRLGQRGHTGTTGTDWEDGNRNVGDSIKVLRRKLLLSSHLADR